MRLFEEMQAEGLTPNICAPKGTTVARLRQLLRLCCAAFDSLMLPPAILCLQS